MARIIYYVASSIDGFIAGQNDDISDFVPGGKGVEKYLADLQKFKTVIMGRRTYEFGYQFGLEPGKPAYPHMELGDRRTVLLTISNFFMCNMEILLPTSFNVFNKCDFNIVNIG